MRQIKRINLNEYMTGKLAEKTYKPVQLVRDFQLLVSVWIACYRIWHNISHGLR